MKEHGKKTAEVYKTAETGLERTDKTVFFHRMENISHRVENMLVSVWSSGIWDCGRRCGCRYSPWTNI